MIIHALCLDYQDEASSEVRRQKGCEVRKELRTFSSVPGSCLILCPFSLVLRGICIVYTTDDLKVETSLNAWLVLVLFFVLRPSAITSCSTKLCHSVSSIDTVTARGGVCYIYMKGLSATL